MPEPESGRIVLICQIRLAAFDVVPFFQRRPGSYCAKPAWIRSGGSGQVFAKRFWSGSKPVCKNHRDRFRQNAGTTGPLPASHIQSLLPQTAGIMWCKTSPDRIWLWLTVKFWKNVSGPVASRCARISGQHFRSDPDPARLLLSLIHI